MYDSVDWLRNKAQVNAASWFGHNFMVFGHCSMDETDVFDSFVGNGQRSFATGRFHKIRIGNCFYGTLLWETENDVKNLI